MSLALVTGGNGYFGDLLVRQLVQHGHSVRVLDISPVTDAVPGVDYMVGDICDAAAVRAACEGVDVAYHNVAQVPLHRDDSTLTDVNVGGTRNLLDAARDANVRKVVHTSSSAVFGVPEHNPVLTTTAPRPQEAYGRSKWEAEQVCHQAAADGLDVSIVRPRTIVGHGRLGIFGILFDWIADGADVVVLGKGHNRYQFVHADDLAALCLAAGAHEGPVVLHGGAADVRTMRETLESVCRHAGTGAKVRSFPVTPTLLAMRGLSVARLAPFAPYHWLMYSKEMWFDLDSTRAAVGWEPRWSTEAMFAQSYDWFLEHRASTHDAGASHHRSAAKQGVLGAAKWVMRRLP